MKIAARWSAHRQLWADEPFRRHVANLSLARAISVTGSRAASIAWVAVIFTRSGGSEVERTQGRERRPRWLFAT
jgi:hypothetical protein